ncbi:VOC family protein [Arthrospiribacter ruber]|uniref:VOC family protein n=1 Tax=Arthrospiribacter ruber TaxID=2487934 RepID=A0A951IZ28_9BACT|nr:VOC family protein [Arthrospiribacter ruber]MBW3468496.1 VOC family protein [Arthrospiribacter ruber]
MNTNSIDLPLISGIQQVGIGVSDAHNAWGWYRKYFGMDVPVFEDVATASLMTRYTGDEEHCRHAILAMNLQGGGGFEIWQYTSREPVPPGKMPCLGDLGIFAIKIRARDVEKAFRFFEDEKLDLSGKIEKSPDGRKHFFIRDPFKNLFQVIESDSWFSKNKDLTGGVAGFIAGVSNLQKSMKFYQELLGFSDILYHLNNCLGEDLPNLDQSKQIYSRVLLTSNAELIGAFGQLLCKSEIELIQTKNRKTTHIFEKRYWGDLGFIHVCFDIRGMEKLELKAQKLGYNFTVNSTGSFDMGKAAGHFSYVEDPDGTLIEFVETHKVPIGKKLGIYLNLKKRNPSRPLPKWMIKLLAINRVKK